MNQVAPVFILPCFWMIQCGRVQPTLSDQELTGNILANFLADLIQSVHTFTDKTTISRFHFLVKKREKEGVGIGISHQYIYFHDHCF